MPVPLVVYDSVERVDDSVDDEEDSGPDWGDDDDVVSMRSSRWWVEEKKEEADEGKKEEEHATRADEEHPAVGVVVTPANATIAAVYTTVTCHNCGSVHHKIAACTLPKGGVCYNCQSIGHRAAQCPWERMCRSWRDTAKCAYRNCTFAHAWEMRCWDCGELGHVRDNCTYKEFQ